MKKQFLLLAIIFISLISLNLVYAETEVSGNISTDTIFTSANSPYIVTGTIQVLEGVKLTIEPGVIIKFNEDAGLSIGGELVAVGSQDSMIKFTSSQSNLPSSPDSLWKGIKFVDASIDAQTDNQGLYLSGSIIEYCIIEYAGSNSRVEAPIYITESSPFIKNNTITNNSNGNGYSGGGINILSGSPVIENNTITNNITGSRGGGIYIDQSFPIIKNNTITNNSASADGGGIFIISGAPIIKNNIITGNSTDSADGGGIFIMYGTPIIKNNTITNNSTASKGGGIYINNYEPSIDIENNTITNNIANSYGGGIYIEHGFPIIKNNIVTDNSAEKGRDFYNEGDSSVTVTNNWWGTTVTSIIDEKIYDYYDDISLGKVNYEPFALAELKFDNNDIFSVAPVIICTSFVYSEWLLCSSSGQQTRTIISSSPSGCEEGDPVLNKICEYVPSCDSDVWVCEDWGECLSNESQFRKCIKTFDCPNIQTPSPEIKQYCEISKNVLPNIENDEQTIISENKIADLQEVEQRKSEVVDEEQEQFQIIEKDNEIGEDVEAIAQTQIQNQEKLEIGIQKIQSRNGFVKFFIGPDYSEIKNLEKVLKQNKEQIQKLNEIKIQVVDQEEKSKALEQIQIFEDVDQEVNILLDESKKGFSIFGWIFELFGN
ncbi:MAG: right-handed parallel beta-helix repeat-containing protein [Bacilli bacterium]